jgi:hypothetical protein
MGLSNFAIIFTIQYPKNLIILVIVFLIHLANIFSRGGHLEWNLDQSELLRMRKIQGVSFLSDLVEISRVASENNFY